MAEQIDLPAVIRFDGINPCLVGGGHDRQFRHCIHIFPQDRGVAGMGNIEFIIHTAEQDVVLPLHMMGKDAEQFLVQLDLFDPVMVIQTRLCAPAHIKRGVNMDFAPVHQFHQFVPVIHFLKFQMLHRCSGDDQSVKGLVLHIVEGLIEGQHMLVGGVLELTVAGCDEFQFDLDGRVSQHTGKLCLGLDFGGHQVHDKHTQSTDVLRHSAGLRHEEYVLPVQDLCGRQIIGYFNRHANHSPQ